MTEAGAGNPEAAAPPSTGGAGSGDGPEREAGWTGAVRDRLTSRLSIDELLPTRQPSYVGSWVYVFGVVTIAALVWVVVSGVVLALMGSAWWHTSSLGHFFNSIHFWSVQMFFIFMVLHFWGQYWGAGWRDGRSFRGRRGVPAR